MYSSVISITYREQSGYKLLAYCLMGNHIHLLIKIGTEELSGELGHAMFTGITGNMTEPGIFFRTGIRVKW